MIFYSGICFAGQAWWETAWPLRVNVSLDEEFTASQLPGDDVGVVEFHTGGKTRDDGGDVRVCTADNVQVRHKVLCCGPGDLIRVAFAPVSGVKDYYVYYGNQSAVAESSLDIKRGLMLESWRYVGGNADAYPQATITLEKSKKNPKNFVGCGFVPRIFSAINPFTGNYSLINVYTGWFVAPQSGSYLFIISSNNASFLSIDSKLLLETPAWHGPVRQPTIRRNVSLTAGLHRMDVLQVTPRGYPTMAVYWRQPGESGFEVMPAQFFTRIYSATAGLPERYGLPGTLDIRVNERGEAVVDNRHIQRRVFEVVGSDADGEGWQWDFGDGQTGAGRKVSHVYLHDGVYAVTAKKGFDVITQRYYVSRDWPMVMRDVAEEPAGYGKIVGDYDLSAVSATDLMTAVELFKMAGNWDGMMRLCEMFVNRPNITARELESVLGTYCDMLILAGQAGRAAQALEKLAAGRKHGDAAVALYVRAGDIYLYELDDVDAAVRCYRFGRQDDDVPQKMSRREIIAAGDACMAAGDYSQANKYYMRAGLSGDLVKKNPVTARGNFARQAEDYLHRGEYELLADVLEKWEDAIPTDRLTGYLTLLRVRMFGEQGRYVRAVNCAARLVNVNPQSQYAPQLLLAGAEYAQKNSQPQRAAELLEKLLKNYPESPLCDNAKKLLNQWHNSQ